MAVNVLTLNNGKHYLL